MKKVIFISLVLILVLTLSGCGGQTVSNGKKNIVVTYSVLGAVVQDLVGSQANVIVLIPNGLDPHDWEPSAKDIEKVNNADLVVRNGLGLEAGLERTLTSAQKQGVKIFTASDYFAVRHVGQGEGIPSDDPDQAIGAADPHFWMDPLSIKTAAEGLSGQLKSQFGWDLATRLSDLSARLDSLNQSIDDSFKFLPVESRNLVTGHESMGYFAQRYQFKLVGVIVPSLSSKAEVTAANLAALKVAVQKIKVKAIFTELGTSAATAKTISDETGVKVVELNTHSVPADGSYFTFMHELAATIAAALK